MKGDAHEIKKLTALMMLGLGVSVAQAAELPNITILATGGTIAGSGETAVSSAYKAGQLNVEALIDAVPEIKQLANVKGEQIRENWFTRYGVMMCG